jgi:hypothetical protein
MCGVQRNKPGTSPARHSPSRHTGSQCKRLRCSSSNSAFIGDTIRSGRGRPTAWGAFEEFFIQEQYCFIARLLAGTNNCEGPVVIDAGGNIDLFSLAVLLAQPLASGVFARAGYANLSPSRSQRAGESRLAMESLPARVVENRRAACFRRPPTTVPRAACMNWRPPVASRRSMRSHFRRLSVLMAERTSQC